MSTSFIEKIYANMEPCGTPADKDIQSEIVLFTTTYYSEGRFSTLLDGSIGVFILQQSEQEALYNTLYLSSYQLE